MHMLKVQFFRNSIPRYLEKLDTTEGDSAIANKTGALDHVRNDVGAVDHEARDHHPVAIHARQRGHQLDSG